MKRVLDVTCGSRMFYFDKQNQDVLFCDHREFQDELSDGRQLIVSPDVVADFRDIPFDDESFYMVIFDPPHLEQVGQNSWLAKKYGVLNKEWRKDIKKGFEECYRVLKKNGVLIFKWSEVQISVGEVRKAIPYEPLFGQKRGNAIWMVFMK